SAARKITLGKSEAVQFALILEGKNGGEKSFKTNLVVRSYIKPSAAMPSWYNKIRPGAIVSCSGSAKAEVEETSSGRSIPVLIMTCWSERVVIECEPPVKEADSGEEDSEHVEPPSVENEDVPF